MSGNSNQQNLPEKFISCEQLEEFMTRPSQTLINDLADVEGDILVLGVSGKMGPTLARLAKRAAPQKRIIGVARFSNPGQRQTLENHGVETIRADLLDDDQLSSLPKLENVIFMAGFKFGATGNEDYTWAMNVHCPALVAQAFRESRIVSLSTACVYPFADVASGGAKEDLAPNPPGEYAQSCVGRERMFQYFSRKFGTSGCLIRLSYAIDLRYGVLHDLARKVFDNRPVDLTTGYANVIWQGDANRQILRALKHCSSPPMALNVSNSPPISIRDLAERFAVLFNKPVQLTGTENARSWLINTSKAQSLFGPPAVSLESMVSWTADWILRGGESLGKPTHFEIRDGAY